MTAPLEGLSRGARGFAAVALLALPLALRPGGAPVAPPCPPALWQAPGRPAGLVLASWYGPGFAGRLTASGAPYDPSAMTCAHPTLPLGTRVRAIRLDDGRSVELTVTDRGPYCQGRGLDVSRAAAHELGFEGQGLCALRLEVIPSASMAGPAVQTWPISPNTGDMPQTCQPPRGGIEKKIESRLSTSAQLGSHLCPRGRGATTIGGRA